MDGLGCKIGKAIERDVARIVDESLALADDVKATSLSNPLKALQHAFRLYYYSNDGVLRTLASVFGKDGKPNPTIEKLADRLFAPPGRADKTGTGVTAAEAIDRRVLQSQNRLAKLLAPFENRRPRDQEQIRKQIITLLTQGTPKEGQSDVHTAAAGIKKLLSEWLDYAREAGMDLGDVGAKYFPRELDLPKVLGDAEKFRAAAAKAYRASGAGPEEAKELAKAWYRRVRESDLGFRADGNDFVQINKGTGTKFEKGRVLGANADNIMSEFYIQDPVEVLSSYFTRIARRAEWVRIFGQDLEHWKTMKSDIEAAGAGEAVPEVVRTIQSAFGMTPALEGKFSRGLVSALRVYGAVRFLTRATFSSLTEPLVMAVRSGNVVDALEGYTVSLRDMLREITGVKDPGSRVAALRDLAEDIGVVSALGDHMLMTARFGGEAETHLARKVMGNFFVRTGLHNFAEGTRVAAVSVGRAFLRRLAKSIDGKGVFEKSSRMLMGELGVKDVDTFSKWLVAQTDGLPTIDTLRGDGAEVKTYREALARFAEQSILKPRAIEKPRYANHPIGSLFYQLQSYIYGFQKNVLNRVGNLSLDALYRNKDLDVADRIRLLAPAGILPLVFAGQAGLNEIRKVWLDDPGLDPKYKEKTPAENMMLLLSRSGLTGTADTVFNIVTSAKYSRSPEQTLLGPTLGAPGEFINTAVKLFTDDNSAKTNTAERKAAKVTYEAVVAPLATAMLSLLPGKAGALLSAAAIQEIRTPEFREENFVEPLAGAPKFKSSGGGRGGGSRSGNSRAGNSRSGSTR